MSKPTPTSPPPAYTDLTVGASSSSESTDPNDYNSVAPPPPTQSGFGPTPLFQQQAILLPYYDPRSPHSIALAVSRARWRFFEAAVWGIGLWMICMAIVGYALKEGMGQE